MNVILRELNTITPYIGNPKRHQRNRICESLLIGCPPDASPVERQRYALAQGIDQPIVLDGAGVIIKGHGRYEAAQSLGLTVFPCVVRHDLTPTQVRLARLADNRSSEGGWDAALTQQECDALAATLPDVALATHGLDALWRREIAAVERKLARPAVAVAPDPQSVAVAPTAAERIPLAIVLTAGQSAEWIAYKQELSVKTDTQAFLRLWENR